jgi:hypothetical protein
MVALMHHAILLRDLKQYAEQASVLAELVRIAERHPGRLKPLELDGWRAARAIAVKEQGRLDEAEPLLRDALAALRGHGSTAAEDVTFRRCLLALADVAQAKGRVDEAAGLRDEARGSGDTASPSTGPATHPVSTTSPVETRAH